MGKALGTVFKIITGSPLSLIDKDLGRTVSGIGLTIAGIATGNPILAGIGMGRLNGGSPKVPLASIDRLTLSLDPGAYRPSVFGQTAMATDARYERPSGTDQRYIDYIIGVAAHRVESIDEIWLDGKIAWSASTGYAAWTIVGGVNRLTVAVRTEGTAGNAINIGGAWNGTARLTGCAYVHIRIDRQGTKKTDSPFAGGLPSALRIIGKGWPLYDPRLDSTRGGSGAHRADDQATWGTASGRENTALQILNHLIGWKIGGALSVGKGVPLDDIDFASFLVEANHCDESVAMVGGGTQPRYRSAGVGNEGDDTTLGALLAACNGELVDVRGKIGLRCAKNDLAVPIAHFETKNILGPVRRSTGNVTEIPNVIRGRYTDASNNALYSMADIPEVKVPGTHAVERVLPFDLPFVQDAARAQRILKQVLQRAQYQDTWDAEYDLTALKCRAHDVITQDFEPRGMVDALFRVRRQVLTTSGRIQQTLRVENAAIYDWDAEEAAAVSAADPQVFDPLNAGAILAAVDAATTANWSGVNDDGGKPENDATANPAAQMLPDILFSDQQWFIGLANRRDGSFWSADFPATHSLQFVCSGGATNAYVGAEDDPQLFPVQPGTRVVAGVYAYPSAPTTSLNLIIYWYDQYGDEISGTASALEILADNVARFRTISGLAPDGAAFCAYQVGIPAGGVSGSWGVAKPFLGFATPGADVTRENPAGGLVARSKIQQTGAPDIEAGAAPFEMLVQDGDVVTFPTPLALTPIVTFSPIGLPAIAAGETHSLRAESLTGTGCTVRIKKRTSGGAVSTITAGPGSAVTPGLEYQLSKGNAADARDGTYKMRLKGNIRGRYIDWDGWTNQIGGMSIEIFADVGQVADAPVWQSCGVRTIAPVWGSSGLNAFDVEFSFSCPNPIGDLAGNEFRVVVIERAFGDDEITELTSVTYQADGASVTETSISQAVVMRVQPQNA